MKLKGKKILVTGADGFIGSHLVEHLVGQGHNVKAFVMYNSFSSWGWLDDAPANIIKNVEIFPGDIRDPAGVREAMKGCDVVLHLAALVAIPYSYHSPDTYVDTNIKGTLNILQAARDLEIDRVLHTSTSEVYGTAQFVPIHEDHPMQGQSPYSASKIGADQMALAFHRSFDTPVTILRPFNTYGPRQSARAVIPTVITQIASGKTKIDLGNTTPTRDFTFISDTVKGFVSAAECDDIIGDVVNIGSGFEISIEDTAQAIARAMNKDITIINDNKRVRPAKSEVERLFACTKKAQKALSWNPEYAGIDGFVRGLKITADWFQDPAHLKHYKAQIYNI